MLNFVREDRERSKEEVLSVAGIIDELREEIDVFHKAADRCPFGVFFFSPRGTVDFINMTAARMFSISRAEAAGRSAEEVLPRGAYEKFIILLNGVRRTRAAQEDEEEMELPDGRRVLHLMCIPLQENERIRNLLFYVYDLTERKKAEERLYESESNYRMLAETANSIILRWSPEGRIYYINSRGAGFLGYERSALFGEDVDKIFGRDVKGYVRKISGEPERYRSCECLSRKTSGEEVWISWSNRPVFGANGLVREILSVGNDITQLKKTQEEMERRGELLDAFFGSSPLNMTIMDENFRYVRVNGAAVRHSGLPPEKILGRSIYSVYPPIASEVAGMLKDVLSTGKTMTGEVSGMLRDGDKRVTLMITCFPVKLFGSEPGIGVIALDVTALKEAEKALSESERNYRELVENTGNIVFKTTFSGDVLYANRAFGGMLGYRSTGDLPEGVWTLYRRRKDRERLIEKLKQTGRVRNFKTSFTAKNGETVEVLISARLEEGVISGFVTDITLMERSRERLRASETKFRTIFEAVSDAIIVMDPSRDAIIDANPGAGRITGYSADSLKSLPLKQFLRESLNGNFPEFKGFLRELKKSNEPKIFELELKRGGGERRYTAELHADITVSEGRPLVYAVIIDITGRKAAEREREEAMRMKTRLFSSVSHELRTPLTSIKEGIGLVLDGSAGPINNEQADFLGIAKRNIDRLHRLINDVLDLSRLEHSSELDLRPHSFNEVVEEAVKAARPVASEKGLYLRADLDKALGSVMFDRDRVMQVISNILDNALKFTKSGGIKVRSFFDAEKKTAVLSVRDTGPGIRKEDLGRIFEEFVNTEGQAKQGSGLGLAISSKIIEGHGGSIKAESEPGKGSEFTFAIPAGGKERVDR